MNQSAKRRRRVAQLLVSLVTSVMAPSSWALVNCSASATGLVFGIYNPLAVAPTVTTGLLTVSCTLVSGGAVNVPLRVDLSVGGGGSYGGRALRSGTQSLNYNIFWSTAYTQIWGDGTGGSFGGTGGVFLTPAAPTATDSGTLYGRMNARQDVLAGNYSDTIVITVTY